MRRVTVAAGAVLLTLLLAACSGVPTHSNPEVIGPVVGGVAPSAASVVTPPVGADQRQIVQGFLDANVSEDARHTSARNYLTADASKKWSTDTTALIVTNPVPGVPQASSVIVSASKVGSLDTHGIYSPVKEGSGSTPTTFPFGLVQVNGEWRINTLPTNGLIIDQDAFLQTYKPRPLYFFDQSQRRLLPDLRYSPLTDQTLCSWLLEELAAGPRPELQSAFTSDLPEQTAHAAVVFGTSIAVDLPGAAQLDAPTRGRLGAQLAYTFAFDFTAPRVVLTDSSKAVAIPQVNQPFSKADFPQYQVAPSPAVVYYVRDGAVYSDNGSKASGQAGATGAVNTIAVAQRGANTLVAATKGKPEAAQLAVGPLNGALTTTNVPAGPLSRPAWAVGLQEVWVGDDTTLLRIPSLGAGAVAVKLSSSSGAVSGQIRSVAFSPDGVRIALILRATDGTSQLWIGTIVRTADGASVESLQSITPVGLTLTDVAWNDTSTLYTVGGDPTRVGGYGIWSVQVDGSLLTARSTTGLPSAPDSITTSQSGFPWVSANTAVWVQRGQESSWTAPSGGTALALGSSPNYLQ